MPTSSRPTVDQVQLTRARQNNLGHQLVALAADFERRTLAAYAHLGFGDIRPAHGAVLRNLDQAGTRITILSRRAGVTHRAIAKLVDELEILGYVGRRPAREDGRVSLVCLTDRGRQLLSSSRTIIGDILKDYGKSCGAGRIEQLEHAMLRLIQGLELELPDTALQPVPGYTSAWHLGRLLAVLGKDYADRCGSLMHERGHSGIQTGHTAVLSHLSFGGMTQTELADHAGITRQAIGKQVKSLRRLGYVEVRNDSRDGRVRRVYFSPQGHRFLEDLLDSFADIETDYREAVGARQLGRLQRELQTVLDALNLQVPLRQPNGEKG